VAKSYAETFADRRIYLLRHADAEPGDQMDATRGITKLGKKQAKAQAKFLDLIGVSLDLIITSGFVRSDETGAYFEAKRREETPALQPDGTPEGAWEAINRLSVGYNHVLIISHGPLVHQILEAASYLFAPGEKVFSHGSMVKFGSDGTFHWFMTAKLAGKIVGIKMQHAEGEVADVIEAAADLIESLDLPHKARVIDPLVARLKRATRRALKAGEATAKWNGVYDSVIRKAHAAGARQALSELGPVQKLTEARKPVVPNLPDPARMAELAALDIDWTDPDFSNERAQMIAEFEVSTAFHDGMKGFVGLWKGGNGPVEKSWQAQDDACEICLANEAEGWIDEEAPFGETGDFEPPAHPNCRCSLEYRQTPEE
jgi:phosphohistidine phosphatase SixA